ncbi:MAG: putative modification methylase [Acidimicrobiales bacterium]|nr:putative modification methylase [Acidimicrobiales bacterium]
MGRRHRHSSEQLSLGHGLGMDIEVQHIDEIGEHGEVFTRRWIVEFILDLAGYTADRDLAAFVAVEPSCGAGAFLVPMVERLISSCIAHGRSLDDIGRALRAFDLVPANAELAQKAVRTVLLDAGLDERSAIAVGETCVRCADFLLSEHEAADFVLGNPPYIRLEQMSPTRRAAYRRACPTMRGRSDIFVGFIEMGLRTLAEGGVLGFIVADRWMHNQYGRDLRKLVSKSFAVETVIAMHDVNAFEEPVSAYPAITILRRAAQTSSVVANAAGAFSEREASSFLKWVSSRRATLETGAVKAARMPTWFDTDSSWPSGNPANLSLVADLERRFPLLEDVATGTRVGIGVATGIDSVFLTTDSGLVEPDRLLPLLMTRDTTVGLADWSGTYLVNPWDGGRLVELDNHPRLRRYLESKAGEVRHRHIAQKNPNRWYRTIDRVEPGLLEQHKLVIPDLKAFLHPVLDRGMTYPHHGLYFITSTGWDLEVLGGLLLSDIAELFVATYCVKMRGGCYRFQAQYLRRIRVPPLESIKRRDRVELSRAFKTRDRALASAVARRLYGLSPDVGLDIE